MRALAQPRLRVLIVLKTNEGGLWILPHIAELRERGHEVVVLLPGGPGRLRRALDDRRVPVVESSFDFCFTRGARTVLGLVRLRRQLRRLGPDVVQYHLYASALAVRFATVGSRVPTVHMVAGPLYLDVPWIRGVERVLSRRDTVLIAGSQHTSDRYRPLVSRRTLLTSVPYGVDTTRFVPSPAEERRRARAGLEIDDDVFVAVIVSYVYAPKSVVHAGSGIKGHDILLRSWRCFVTEHPRSMLLVVGSGFDVAGERHRDELRGVDAGPAHSVRWIDSVADVRPYYAAADVSVSPSLSENHGAALEAGARGLPSIVSDAGGLPETVDTTSGWVVAAGAEAALTEALAQAASEHRRGVLSGRGTRAREHVVQRFDSAAASRSVVDLIERSRRRGPERGAVRVVSEVRLFGSRGQGRWYVRDGTNTDHQWARYRHALGPVELIARGNETTERRGRRLADTPVLPLPDYTGILGLTRAVPAIVPAVARATRGAGLVVVRLPGPLGALAAVASLVRRQRYAVELVGDPTEVLRSGSLGLVGVAVARPAGVVVAALVRKAAAVRYVTQSTLQTRYPAAPTARTEAVSTIMLDASAFIEGRDRARPPGRGPARLIAIGSQENSYKGHDVLIRLVSRLRAEGRDVSLELLGAGRWQPTLRRLAVTCEVADHVTFHGHVEDRAEITALLDRADVFVHASRTEGLPRVVIEAMARGLPVVATAAGGTPELVRPADLVPVDDVAGLSARVASLCDDPQQWRASIDHSERTAAGFRPEVTAAAFTRWLNALRETRDHRRAGRDG